MIGSQHVKFVYISAGDFKVVYAFTRAFGATEILSSLGVLHQGRNGSTILQLFNADISPVDSSNVQNLYKLEIKYLMNGTNILFIQKYCTYNLFSLFQGNMINMQQFPTNVVPPVLYLSLE